MARFQEAARRGDWAGADRLASELSNAPVPASPEEIAEYLERLQHALTIARASRSAAAATLSRIRAAAHFNSGYADAPRKRQNFVVPTNC